MQKTEIVSKLTDIFRTTFGKNDLVISESMTADDVDGWDSFNHINLIMTTEERFGITFALGELKELKNVGALISLIEKKTSH